MLVRVTLFIVTSSLLFKSLRANYNKTALLRLLLTPRIVNGEVAQLEDVPFQVGFKTPMKFIKNTYRTFCGGSILNETTVLSAAHCFVPRFQNPLRLNTQHYKTSFAVAGTLKNIAKYKEYGYDVGQWRKITLIRYPPNYIFPKEDIAIVHLASPFVFGSTIKPIPIATELKEYSEMECIASGYGRTAMNERSEILQKVPIDVIPMEWCQKRFRMDMYKYICAATKVTNVNKGDSGGPLVCKQTGDKNEGRKGVLVGIVSGGKRVVSFFTRVSSYQDFIALNTTSRGTRTNLQCAFSVFLIQLLFHKIS